MVYKTISNNLFLIDLDQNITGFRKFISSWLYKGISTTFLVDPGPSSSVNYLLETLETLDVKNLDYILLTHIHIDHAGGTGAVLGKYPDAMVICHPKGIDHMIDPQKLWEGSLKVLGDIARAYGEVIPVPAEKIVAKDLLETDEGQVAVIPTPGHAIHHQCFQFKDWLFAGEVAGVRHFSEHGVYARPATPPVFKLEISLASLDRVIELKPKTLCLGHYGFVDQPDPYLRQAREQLLYWVETAREESAQGTDELTSRIVQKLILTDRLTAEFNHLEQDIQQREEYFISNSIKGMLHYLQKQV